MSDKGNDLTGLDGNEAGIRKDLETAEAVALSTAVEEVWTYLGVRMVGHGDSEHHWLGADDQPKIFTKLKGPVVGGRYKLQVTHKGDGHCSVVPDPRYVGQAPNHAAIVAEHRANETAIEAYRVAKKETTEAIDNMTIAELRAKMKRLPVTRSRALLAVILDRLHNGKVE